MSLLAGTRLGPYEIVQPIGKGGMGEVYRARDTKLDREVAIKVLPEAFANDEERRARFEREAKLLASLNHPNIAGIYGFESPQPERSAEREIVGVGRHDMDEGPSVPYIVLELVEGPTLAERIQAGPLPVDEAMTTAKQIALALEAGHEAGVIHRDLKPANIKIKEDGTVKVLDYGLAKALEGDTASTGGAELSQSPTLTRQDTQLGMILGTAAYMSPEQARGKRVDRRSDIWAFGAVVYEMLTGQRAFAGEDVSDTLAAVIRAEPDMNALAADTPESLRLVLRLCLTKDVAERFQSMGDVRLALHGAFERPAATEIRRTSHVWERPALILGLIVSAALTSVLAVSMMARPDAVPTGVVQFSIVPPVTAPFGTVYGLPDVVISPDGTQVVYSGPDSGGQPQLHLRSLDHAGVAPLRGAAGGVGPFVSPDSQWIGFTSFPSFTTLHKVPIAGGPPVTLATSSSPIRGASWGADGQIIYGTASAGLFRVSDTGGEPEALTTLDTRAGETSHTWPYILPGREASVFVIDDGPVPLLTGQLAVLAIDSGQITRLGLKGTSPRYLPTGHLVYVTAERALQAVAFDATSLRITGNPVSLVEGVTAQGSGAADFSVSENGRLVYTLGNSEDAPRSLVWVDRAGREEPIPAPPRRYRYPRISPDGTRVAVDINDEGELDIWVWDLVGNTLSRLTSDHTLDTYGHWTPDGQRIVFTSGRDGPLTIYWKSVNGTGTATRLTANDAPTAVNAVTPDGAKVLAQTVVPQRGRDLIVVPMESGDGTETVVLSTEFDEGNAALSPDGKWVAFETDESGEYEVHVRPFPDVDAGRWPISAGGGQDPAWSREGDELFYWAGNRLMAVPIHTDASSVERGTPQMLFEGTYYQALGRTYDVAADGRFLMLETSGPTEEDAPAPQITVVLNWHQEVLSRVPSR